MVVKHEQNKCYISIEAAHSVNTKVWVIVDVPIMLIIIINTCAICHNIILHNIF